MVKRIILSVVLIVCVIFMTSSVSASGVGALGQIINQGTNFGNGDDMNGLGTAISNLLRAQVLPAIGVIGNLIFAAVTVILGAKYIWSSAEGKADVQESLPALVVAIVFFYLAGALVDSLTGGLENVASADDWSTLSSYIIYIINQVVKYAAIGGVIFIGVKYMLASADGKASVKTSLSGLVIGLLLVFTASNIVEFVVKSARQLL